MLGLLPLIGCLHTEKLSGKPINIVVDVTITGNKVITNSSPCVLSSLLNTNNEENLRLDGAINSLLTGCGAFRLANHEWPTNLQDVAEILHANGGDTNGLSQLEKTAFKVCPADELEVTYHAKRGSCSSEWCFRLKTPKETEKMPQPTDAAAASLGR